MDLVDNDLLARLQNAIDKFHNYFPDDSLSLLREKYDSLLEAKPDYLLIYLGVSVAVHAFPSTGDAQAILNTIRGEDTKPLTKIIGYPIIGLIYLGSLGSFFWLDLLYGIAIAVGLPNLVISLLV